MSENRVSTAVRFNTIVLSMVVTPRGGQIDEGSMPLSIRTDDQLRAAFDAYDAREAAL